MTGKTHGSVTAEVAHILSELKERGPEEIRFVYGIEIRDDHTVYDFAYDREFKDLVEWVHYNNELAGPDYEEEYTSGWDDGEDY